MLADAKTYLNKNNIPLTDADFVTIRQMLEKDLKYCYLFTFLHYDQNIPVVLLQELYNELRNLKDHLTKLPTDVLTYRNWSVLQKDLTKLKQEIVLKKFIDYLPADLAKAVFTLLAEQQPIKFDVKIEAAQQKLIAAIDKFMLLQNDYRKDFVVNVSRLTTARQVTTALNAYLKFVETGKDIATIKNTWQDIYGLKKVYEDEKIFLAETTELETIKQIGTTSWCIARDFGHWRSYIGRNDAKQYVLWNAHANVTSPDYQIAFTIYKDITPDYVAHNRRNTSIKLEQYFKKYNIEYLRKEFTFKTVNERVIEGLEYFTRFPKKKNEWTTYRFEQINFYDIGVIKSLTSNNMLECYQKYSDTDLYKLIDSSTKTSGAVVLYYLFLARLGNVKKFWSSFFLRTPQFYKLMVERPEPRKYYKTVLSFFLKKKHERQMLNSFESFLSSAISHHQQHPIDQLKDFWTELMPDIYTFVTTNNVSVKTKTYLTTFVAPLTGRNEKEIETRQMLGTALNIKEIKKVEKEQNKSTNVLERWWNEIKPEIWKNKKKPKTNISPSAHEFITSAIYSLLEEDKKS